MPRWPLVLLIAAASAISGGSPSAARPSTDTPPTAEELHERAKALIANQHANDAAIEQYERFERQMDRAAGMNPRVLDDKEYRVVPTGFGNYKILVQQDGKDVAPAEYRRQLQKWAEALQISMNPSDPRARDLQAKFDKRMHDRAELIDAMQEAFTPKWLGRETKNGRFCDVLELVPNPQYHPRSLLQEALTHVTVKIWVDHASNQLVRGEASVTRDISVGGGIFGKLYRGGVFAMDQQEFAPGVWLPVRLQYDYTIRKFLFTSEEHQLMEATRYKRLGTPKDAFAVVQAELAKTPHQDSDP